MKIAILLHLYYHDLWEEMAVYFSNIPFDYDLYVNLIEGNEGNDQITETIRKRFPEAKVYVTENRGRDIGGYLRLLDKSLEHDYDVLLLAHTKKSPINQPGFGDTWRTYLLRSIIGWPDRAAEAVLQFMADPKVGMVASESCIFSRRTHPHVALYTNGQLINQLCDKYGISKKSGTFVAGTIFLVRASIFKEFFSKHKPLEIAGDLQLGEHDDRNGPSRTHAWERLFGYLVTSSGYTIKGYRLTL